MFEYVFFDKSIAKEFAFFVISKEIEATIINDDEMITVEVPENIEDELSEVIDLQYERLLQKNAALLEQGSNALEKNVAGVQVALSDGSPCTIRLDPDLVSRILSAITMEELRDLAQVIAEGVERGDNSPLCHTIKEQP